MKKFTKRELKFIEAAAKKLGDYRILMEHVSKDKMEAAATEFDFMRNVSNYLITSQINLLHEIIKSSKSANEEKGSVKDARQP